MQDIRQRKDLELLVSEFYKKVLVDDKIAPVFIGKIKIDWESHLPSAVSNEQYSIRVSSPAI